MVSWWKSASHSKKVITVVLTVLISLSVLPFIVASGTAPEEAPAEPVREQVSLEVIEPSESLLEEFERERQELAKREEEVTKVAPRASVKKARRVGRRVKRWSWRSPAEERARVWNVPKEESEGETIEGLIRICFSEQAGSEEDCIGIWQVLNNIRSRSCRKDYIRLITECDANGETLISVMRRASRYVVGAERARYRRQQWISRMTSSCDMPKGFPHGSKAWERVHRGLCERTVELATGLVKGTFQKKITGVRIVTWGGRCEDPHGACDDPIACKRGLARVPGLETANAFWCFPGMHGCAKDVDPICRQYLRLPEGKTFNESYGVKTL